MTHQELDRYREAIGEQEKFIIPEPPTEQNSTKSPLGRIVDKVLRRDNDEPKNDHANPQPVSAREAEIDRKLADVNRKLALLLNVPRKELNEPIPHFREPNQEQIAPPAKPQKVLANQDEGFVLRMPEQEIIVPRAKLQEVVNTLHGLGARIDSLKPKEKSF